MACQSTNNMINKPYDDEICRVGLYNILECLLINERADCSTIIAISKDLIDNVGLVDSSVKVKMAVRKLKLIWQQVHDSTNHLYQPWTFLNIDKPRKVISNNELRNVFAPSSMPIINNIQSSIMNTEQSPSMNSQSISKPSVYQTPIETNTQVFLQAPPPPVSLPFPPMDLLPKTQQTNLETIVQPVIGKFSRKIFAYKFVFFSL